jgi:hypothetical protein
VVEGFLVFGPKVPECSGNHPWPGTVPHPESAYLKALLVKLCEQKVYITDLRRLLINHPLLVLELDFQPVLDPPGGMDLIWTRPYRAAAGCIFGFTRFCDTLP